MRVSFKAGKGNRVVAGASVSARRTHLLICLLNRYAGRLMPLWASPAIFKVHN